MDPYQLVLQKIREQYEKEKNSTSEIILQKNDGNLGGHCSNLNFEANRLYKIILPAPLMSPENFILMFSYHENNETHYCYEPCQKDKFLVEYENDINSFFIKFKISVTSGEFFTNCL